MNPIYLYIIIFAVGFLVSAVITFLFVRSSDQAQINDLNIKVRTLEMEKQSGLEKIQWLEMADVKLREAFEALSSKALRQNADQFLHQSKQQISSFHELMQSDWNTQKQEMKNIVNPIEKDLDKLDKQVQTLEAKREGAYRSIEGILNALTNDQKKLQDATTTLSQALRSSTVRGKWGEVQLRRIAEMAGMVEHVDFQEQKQSQTGTGKPDMIIHLPESGIIPVDAKAPMNHYLDSVEARTEETRKAALVAHVKSIRDTVKSLSQKAYWDQFKESQPQYVVMLIPYESGLSAAFIEDPDLMENALQNKVIIVSPATLLALLKVIALGWMHLHLAKNAQDIALQGRELYDRLTVFFAHFSDIGNKLEGAQKSFNSAVGSMEKRVMPSVRRLKELGAGSADIEAVKEIE